MSSSLDKLKESNANQIRQAISRVCYERSFIKALLWYILDLSLYIAALYGVYASHSPIAKIGFGILAGCITASMFVWAHDAAHGSLLKNKYLAEVLGTLFMLPVLNIYRFWCYGHNKVHHGFTSFSPIDWIWRPLTPTEYAEKSTWQRFIYRLERSPYTCALHYILRVWWSEMICFTPPTRTKKEKRLYQFHKYLAILFGCIACILSYYYLGGWIGILAGFVIPFIVFNYFIAFFIFLHHTHPKIPFFMDRKDWSLSIGSLYCSTIVRCSWLFELFSHNILIHAPHHIDSRIPFYHLKRAYQDLKKQYGQYLNEYQFSWAKILSIFKKCKLYDYNQKMWYNFQEASRILKTSS